MNEPQKTHECRKRKTPIAPDVCQVRRYKIEHGSQAWPMCADCEGPVEKPAPRQALTNRARRKAKKKAGSRGASQQAQPASPPATRPRAGVAPVCPICGEAPQKPRNGQEGVSLGSCEACMVDALGGGNKGPKGKKRSKKQEAVDTTLGLILDRNDRLKAAVHQENMAAAMIAAQDVVDLNVVLALILGSR